MTDTEREISRQSEAETAVLGALLAEPWRYPEAARIIAAGDFAYEFHAELFGRMGKLYAEAGTIDLVSLLEGLPTADEGERRRRKEYLMRLADAVPTTGMLAAWCAIVRKRSIGRQAQAIARAADFAGTGGGDIAEAVQETAERLAALVRDSGRRGARKLGDVLMDVRADLSGEAEDKSLRTGIGTLDRLLDGIDPGDLVTVAAQTGVGKTAFALKLMANMARAGTKTLLYSQEMSDKQNAIRLLAKEAGVDMAKLRRAGRLGDGEAKKVEAAMGRLSALPISIRDSGGMAVEDIRLDCVSDRGLGCIFVDHVGLMKTARRESRSSEVAQIMIGLRSLALEARVPVVALSQFNREANGKPEPDLGCFRDSGEIEQSSSSAVLLWRTKGYDEDHVIGVKVAKNRQGAPGKFHMRFDAHVMDFIEVEGYREPQDAQGWRKADKNEIREVFG